MRSTHQTLVRTAFVTALCLAGACSYAQAPNNLGLNDPKLPIVSGTAKQPAGTELDTAKVPDPTDRSAESSPLTANRHGSTLATNATVSMQMTSSVNSGSVRNGDTVRGVLTGALKTTAGTQLAVGTPVVGTVVSAAKAGTVASAGTLSIQLTRVGTIPVVTDVVDFTGKEGHKDLPDSAPAKGTEAVIAPNTPLQFHVLESGTVPGLVKGESLDKANGGPTVGSGPAAGPAANQGPSTGPGVNQTPAPGMTTPR